MSAEAFPALPDLGETVPPGDLESKLEETLNILKNRISGVRREMESLARSLSHKRFIQNKSNKVRLLAACCIADVFRLTAPESPYDNRKKLKEILEFCVEQFECIQNDDDFSKEKSSYLIASLAKARTLKLYLDLDSGPDFVVRVFTHLMAVVRDAHKLTGFTGLVKQFIVDILASLVNEPDSVSDNLIESMKELLVGRDDSPVLTQMCREIISKAADGLEAHMDRFFKAECGQGRVQSTYELFVELYDLVPQNLTCFVLQLDTKLQDKHDAVRSEATELVARLMATTDLISAFPSLHNSFIARYNDQKYEIRMKCIELSLPLLLSPSALRDEIVEAIKKRQYDVNESVRFQVVFTILKMAEKDIIAASDSGLLDIIKERSLDTNFKVRRLSLLGIGQLYRKFTSRPPPHTDNGAERPEVWEEDPTAAAKVGWIRDKVLHRYYQTNLQDRLIVERILHTCLVPFWLDSKERTAKLLGLFTSSDPNAVKALIMILKFQHTYRQQLKGMMHLIDEFGASDENREKLGALLEFMAQQVSNDRSAKDHILEFLQQVRDSHTLHRLLIGVLEAKTFKEVNENVRLIMMRLGDPKGALFITIKQLLERVAPLVVDPPGVSQILEVVREKLECVKEDEGRRCLELLCVLSEAHPDTFMDRGILEELCDLLAITWEPETNLLLINILHNLRKKDVADCYPDVAKSLKDVLLNMLENGTPKQAKLAVRCISCILKDAESCLSDALDRLKQLVVKSPRQRETILVSLGQIAGFRPDIFNPYREHIIVEVAVKMILMEPQSRARSRSNKLNMSDEVSLPARSRRRIAALRLITNALIGLTNLYCDRATEVEEEKRKKMLEFMNWDAECTLRLLFTAVANEGDLMKWGNLSERERSHFRLKAGTCILKICCFKNFDEIATEAQFRTLVKLVTDPMKFVRERFCEKLHQRLLAQKLPLHYMALFSYGALEPDSDHQERMRGYLEANIKKRREHLKYHDVHSVSRASILPDNVIGYVVHMLAHDPSFTRVDDLQTLGKIRECLWFQLQFHCSDSNANYSFPTYRKLLENIKRCRDRENPHDRQLHSRLYAVCDLALGLIMSRTTKFDHTVPPHKVQLPLRLFVWPGPDTPYNPKYYLPTELSFTPPVNRKVTPTSRLRRTPTTPAGGVGTPRRKRKAAQARLTGSETDDGESHSDFEADE
ncbi:sister chromatid cohesion protein PDS5 homolog B-B [Galendromus occidentalis]|uniref:Sister chromatid cohesion protein PDS5 homolog B-B n=1 Tax=Galendromus occidentalis TaxID=34638 RepID=A0AAJ7L4B4_9ACAR|nr:sister chromatid cohesion protein PDS5 homolog B-B [Galendromus occidentalis]